MKENKNDYSQPCRSSSSFSAISYYTYDRKSWYDALNAKFEKRFTQGYLVAATCTWSKYLVANTLLNSGDAAPAKYLSSRDYPHQVDFAAPNVTPTSSSFGMVTAQMNVPRRIQAMLRLRF